MADSNKESSVALSIGSDGASDRPFHERRNTKDRVMHGRLYLVAIIYNTCTDIQMDMALPSSAI